MTLTACLEQEATKVTLAQLVRYQADYDGRRVITTGVLRTFPDPRHYWIEDAALNRVELHSDQFLDARLDHRVTVTGRFSYAPTSGRSIAVEAFLD